MKKIILLGLLTAFTVLNAKSLSEALSNESNGQEPTRMVAFDPRYDGVRPQWALSIAKSYIRILNTKRITYSANGFDCDDYARGAASLIREQASLRGWNAAAGMLHIQNDGMGVGHAQVIFAGSDGNVWRIEVTTSDPDEVVLMPYPLTDAETEAGWVATTAWF